MDTNKLATAAAAAKNAERVYSVPAKVTLAQWALESGWGEHAPGNNCFGIKEYAGCCGTQELETTEFVKGVEEHIKQIFASFPTLADCFAKHADMFRWSLFYQRAWLGYQKSKNAEQFARAIAPVYATDPAYADKIVAMMRSSHIVTALNR